MNSCLCVVEKIVGDEDDDYDDEVFKGDDLRSPDKVSIVSVRCSGSLNRL